MSTIAEKLRRFAYLNGDLDSYSPADQLPPDPSSEDEQGEKEDLLTIPREQLVQRLLTVEVIDTLIATHKPKPPGKATNFTSVRIGYLTALGWYYDAHRLMWRCVCVCGKEISVHAQKLTSKSIKSCGAPRCKSDLRRGLTYEQVLERKTRANAPAVSYLKQFQGINPRGRAKTRPLTPEELAARADKANKGKENT